MTEQADGMIEFKVGAATLITGTDDALSADMLRATSPESQEAGLSAMLEARKRPVKLTPSKARTLLRRHRIGHIYRGSSRFKTQRVSNQDVVVWRITGKGGAWLDVPPSVRAIAAVISDHRNVMSKGYRYTRLLMMNMDRVGVKARQEVGRATAKAVLSALADGRKVHAIAAKLGITEGHVRRIRRATTKASMTEKG